jgi:galactokinase
MTLEQDFEKRFGQAPCLAVRAPGRINLIGEHIDYLGGTVLPVAIDRYIDLLAVPTEKRVVRVCAQALGFSRGAEIDLEDLSVRTAVDDLWQNYIIGVLAGYRQRGIALQGFDVSLSSNLPVGAGLSSSAALETAIALAVESFAGISLAPLDRALLCQGAEHAYAGVPCGIMDQLAVGASRAGHALWLDCSTHEMRQVPLPDGVSMLVADSGVKHALASGEYAVRRRECTEAAMALGVTRLLDASLADVERHDGWGPRLQARARHAISEQARVTDFCTALERGDLESLGAIMADGHRSLRDDYEVSCPELDRLVEAAYEFGHDRGLIGSRMTGGGFGGSTISLVRSESAASLQEFLEKSFEKSFGRWPNCFITTPVEGAGLVPLSLIPV